MAGVQNFFRTFDKLSGMTGTALTEAKEFSEIYKLKVAEVPTNRPTRRTDSTDVVFRSLDGALPQPKLLNASKALRVSPAGNGTHCC